MRIIHFFFFFFFGINKISASEPSRDDTEFMDEVDIRDRDLAIQEHHNSVSTHDEQRGNITTNEERKETRTDEKVIQEDYRSVSIHDEETGNMTIKKERKETRTYTRNIQDSDVSPQIKDILKNSDSNYELTTKKTHFSYEAHDKETGNIRSKKDVKITYRYTGNHNTLLVEIIKLPKDIQDSGITLLKNEFFLRIRQGGRSRLEFSAIKSGYYFKKFFLYDRFSVNLQYLNDKNKPILENDVPYVTTHPVYEIHVGKLIIETRDYLIDPSIAQQVKRVKVTLTVATNKPYPKTIFLLLVTPFILYYISTLKFKKKKEKKRKPHNKNVKGNSNKTRKSE